MNFVEGRADSLADHASARAQHCRNSRGRRSPTDSSSLTSSISARSRSERPVSLNRLRFIKLGAKLAQVAHRTLNAPVKSSAESRFLDVANDFETVGTRGSMRLCIDGASVDDSYQVVHVDLNAGMSEQVCDVV